jgi:hypothetical protein
MQPQELTKEQLEKIDEIIEFMWTDDVASAVIDNQELMLKLNQLIGLTLALGQFEIAASIIHSVFAFGFMLGREGKLDVSVWGSAIDEAFAKENE